ncbi:MAG: carboxypeptidase-like regulatory domain-containing protein [Rubrivivax sp.]
MNHSDWTGFARTVVSVAVAIAAAPALAQNTTSAVSGMVTGADGRPVAGATVQIVHRESGVATSVTTGADGRYAARGLRVGGPYTVTVTKDGRSDKRDDVFLALAETLALDVQLGAPAATTVVITGQSAAAGRFNSAAMGAGTNLGSRELATLGSIQRNLQDYARTDPRLAQTDKERGEISAMGQNTRFNSITIDGVTTNDTFGLESNNLPTLKQPISIDAIQSVQVNLSNYDVTQKGYTGANINAVTKSGTNEFHGSVYYVFRDDSLAGDRYNRTNGTYFAPQPFEDTTKGVVLGGPIIKDKLFFFASYEEYKSSRTSPVFGPLGSSKTNVGISQSAIDQAIAIARDTWKMDAGVSEVPSGLALNVKDTLLKLDWNISDDHRASLRYTKTSQTEPVLNGFSATGLSLSSWWFNTAKEVESVVGQWFADWSADLSTELKVSKRDYQQRHTPANGTRLPAVGLRFSGALPDGTPTSVSANDRFLNFGTENSRHFNVLDTSTLDVYAGATWNVGAHELKFGADYADNDVFNAFVQNTNGNYTFACEPGTYSFGTFTNCSQMTAAQRDLAVLENFRAGKPSAFTVQVPQAGLTLNDAAAVWSYGNIGAFVQDTWKLNKNLNLMFGLRVDQQQVGSKPLANSAVSQPAVAGTVNGNTYTRATGGFGMDNTVTLDGNNLVQPRFGFNWNLGTPERRAQLRGGLGLFQGAAANVWLSNPFSNTGKSVMQLNCASFTACGTGNLRFSADPDAQPNSLPGVIPAANVDLISPDLEQPSLWKANLAFETETPKLPVVGALTVGAEWLHTKVNKAIFYRHLNLGAPTATGSDGRELFYRAEGFNAACWNANGTPITNGTCATPTGQTRTRALSNAAFGNVILADSTSKGSGDAITLSVGQPAAAGFGWNLAYTRTRATEVSPLTSSTSGSNWSNRNIFNPNEDALQNSNYLTKDRFSASATWSKAFFGSYRTSMGVFYEGRAGKPYSWTYINDLNGDGISGNDLMYIPSAPGSGEVVFRGGAAEEARFWELVNAHDSLKSAAGGVVGRNNAYGRWVNTFDVRLAQELPGFMKGHKASLTFDVFNFGNLLNKKWGRVDEITFPSNRSFVNYAGRDAQGRYVYSLGSMEDFATRQAAGESQWAVQVTLRYEF